MPANPVGPSHSVNLPQSVRQRNAIQMALRWRADGGPHLDVYWMKVLFWLLQPMKCTNVTPVYFEGFCILYIGDAKLASVQLYVCPSVIS